MTGAGRAAELTVELGDVHEVTLLGAVQRWDGDGNPRRPVDTKAKIDAPDVDAKAERGEGDRWVFKDVPPGTYDLVILARDSASSGPLRIEGWRYAPVLEFDPFFAPDASTDEATAKQITEQIAGSRQFENKVESLALGGDDKAVRVLMMLVRDEPTSYEPDTATIRHEIWQFTYRYGGWQKEKRTHVLDRILLPRDELRKWTWLWDARLGGIEVKDTPMTVKYELPKGEARKGLKGLRPY